MITSTNLSYNGPAFVFGENVIFGRGSLTEVTSGQEFSHQNGLHDGGVRVEGHKLEDEAGLAEREEGKNFSVEILARTLDILGRVNHFRLAFLQVIV